MERRPLVLKDGIVTVLPTGDTVPSSNYQKYLVLTSEVYTIPQGISSVVSGPFQNEGTVVVEGRLEIL